MTLLSLRNVYVNSIGSTQPILENINFSMQAKDFVILLGSNGSGKSTFLKLLYRQQYLTSGQIELHNKFLHQYSAATLGSSLSVLSQHSAESLFISLSVYENFIVMKKIQHLPIKSVEEERRQLQFYLREYNPNLADKLESPVLQLSGGERQTLALALCLLKPPALLLLDEHTSALDPRTSNQVMHLTQQMISKFNISCILTTHDLDIALEYGNKILLLQDGKVKNIIDEKEKKQLSKEDLLKLYF